MYNLNNENNQIFISSIIIAILFFMFVMPAIESCYTQEKKNLKEKLLIKNVDIKDKKRINIGLF